MDIKLFVNITSRAWSLPILSSMFNGVPGRQAALIAATGAGRTAFAQSLTHLVELGLMERNPGYGHPLRPEFRLTAMGQEAAEMASQIVQNIGSGDEKLIRKTWTVPILVTLQQPLHFNEIGRRLVTVTDRALSQSLRSMEDRSWVERQVDDSARPPRSIYGAVNAGQVLSDIARPYVSFG